MNINKNYSAGFISSKNKSKLPSFCGSTATIQATLAQQRFMNACEEERRRTRQYNNYMSTSSYDSDKKYEYNDKSELNKKSESDEIRIDKFIKEVIKPPKGAKIEYISEGGLNTIGSVKIVGPELTLDGHYTYKEYDVDGTLTWELNNKGETIFHAFPGGYKNLDEISKAIKASKTNEELDKMSKTINTVDDSLRLPEAERKKIREEYKLQYKIIENNKYKKEMRDNDMEIKDIINIATKWNPSVINMNIDGKNYNFLAYAEDEKDAMIKSLNYETKNPSYNPSHNLSQQVKNIKELNTGRFVRTNNSETFIPYLKAGIPDVKKDILLIKHGNAKDQKKYDERYKKEAIEALSEKIGQEIDEQKLKLIEYTLKDSNVYKRIGEQNQSKYNDIKCDNTERKVAYSYYDEKKDKDYLYFTDNKKIVVENY